MITSLEQVTPAMLTALLRIHGVLTHGDVHAIESNRNAAFNSLIVHLRVHYSADAPPNAPTHLLLKLNTKHAGALEVAFYNVINRQNIALPMVPRCYASTYDAVSGDSLCLLEDVSTTHVAPVTREQMLSGQAVPSATHLDQMIDALAGLHAAWWEHPLLGTIPDLLEVRPWYRDAAYFEQHLARRKREWAQFLDSTGDRLPADVRTLYQDTLAKLPHLWDRYLAPRVTRLRHVTLTHGDCYLSQFLCARAPSGSAYIVDFQDATANFGAYDLAYLLPTFWTSAQRRAEQREERLLQRYHAVLQAHNIEAYRYEDLLTDYKTMITLMIFDPVWNQTAGSSKAYWWPKMQCLIGAFRDLDCAALFT
jgi:aminoglycoside phosphotransferase (APT) family kinase protein